MLHRGGKFLHVPLADTAESQQSCKVAAKTRWLTANQSPTSPRSQQSCGTSEGCATIPEVQVVACRLDPSSTALAPHLLPCPGGMEKCLPGKHMQHTVHACKLCACSQGNAALMWQASSRPESCRGWAVLSCTLGSPGLCLGRTLKRPFMPARVVCAGDPVLKAHFQSKK